MTTYQDFVKAHVAQMPGKSPQARMKEVAAKWRELPASQKTSIAKPRAPSVIKGKGFFTDFVKGVSSVLSLVPGPIGTVARVVNIGTRLFGGGVVMTQPQIRAVAKQMHGGRIFTTAQEAFEEGRRMAQTIQR